MVALSEMLSRTLSSFFAINKNWHLFLASRVPLQFHSFQRFSMLEAIRIKQGNYEDISSDL